MKPCRISSISTLILGLLLLAGCQKSQPEHTFNGPPGITILTPTEGQILPDNDVRVTFKLRNFVAYEGGTHLHLFLDNNPYVSYEKSVEPYTFTNVRPGAHAIRIVLTQPSGESLKNPEAFALVNFYVKKKTEKPLFDPNKPILTLNLPHSGYYKGWLSNRIEFDFLVKNITLQKGGAHLHYILDGLAYDVYTEKPIFWENARRIGEHHLTVELLDGNNQPITGNPFLKVKRSFFVVE
ncbi:MAG: hypothetical protein GXO76_12135 [Calditrichaeota bacterium]|nr:hypothetical protein [Calditrichota bacterium]